MASREKSALRLGPGAARDTAPAWSAANVVVTSLALPILGSLAEHTRMSDVCAWVGDADVALIAYGANVAATTMIVRRLSELSAHLGPDEEGATPISAGIVELTPSQFVAERRTALAAGEPPSAGVPVADQIGSLSRFAAAQNPLRQAREAGGGIRIGETA